MSAIKPALTKEEWASGTHEIGHGITIVDDGGATTLELSENKSLSFVREHRHAVAGLALFGQPFGVTINDAKLLGEVAGRIKGADHAQASLPRGARGVERPHGSPATTGGDRRTINDHVSTVREALCRFKMRLRSRFGLDCSRCLRELDQVHSLGGGRVETERGVARCLSARVRLPHDVELRAKV